MGSIAQRWGAGAVATLLLAQVPVFAQETTPPAGRAALIEQAQAAKATTLRPFEPSKIERTFDQIEKTFLSGSLHWHPFFDSAYSGGGFTLGAGYARHVSSYNVLDLRGSITLSGYKRIEAAFMAPRLLKRRAALTLIGGWREATQVGFFGIGNATSKDDRSNYSFDQPYGSAALEVRPFRNMLVVRGGLDVARWNLGPGSGSAPPVDDIYTPDTLPGLNARTTYLHSEGTLALDSRPAPGYARRGTYLGVTFNDFHDPDGSFGFRRTDYEAIQHLPLLRDTWVLSLRGRVELANAADGQTIPFFMLPSLGGGSSLRGFSSWRFRDRNSLLLSAEWRVLANRFLDMALLYDAGRVADRREDLTTAPLKSNYGLGFRFHGPLTTPLRIEFVKSNEGLNLVFSAKAAF